MSWWWSSKKSEKYPGKFAIVPDVIKFCLSSELFAEVDKVLAATSADGSMGAIDEKEFKLAYTDKYEAFIASFEAKLEEYIKSKKCTVEEFYELCKKAQEMGDDNIEAFVDLLTQVTSFQSFVDLCRDKNKRQYVQHVLAQYSKMLTAS